MTEWTMTTYDGQTLTLPTPLAWRLDYGLGSPCDSFWGKFLWQEGGEEQLADGTRLTVTWKGETVFTGVVDECRCCWSAQGAVAEVSGRGMQALLLDNQAEAADYGLATLDQILRGYVTPYGIQVGAKAALPGVAGFSVSSGQSCWGVVYDFARYHGGVAPRFDRAGKLVLAPFDDGEPLALDKTVPVTEAVWQVKRYGVLSQVTVKDVSGWGRQVVENAAFRQRGGQCSRVLLLPRKTGFQARRYSGQFQLDRSAADLYQAEVTLPQAFAAWPGDLVRLTRAGSGSNGVWRVRESQVALDEGGSTTKLTLCDPAAVL